MALRLLPTFLTDNDDDDGNFTKWMSSYWGHGAEGRRHGERKRSLRRPAAAPGDRRASLPTASQLDAMRLNHLHAAAMAPGPSHAKPREDRTDARNHQRVRRSDSVDSSHSKPPVPENRISTIPELTESFERRLLLRDDGATSPAHRDKLCLICHEDMKRSGGAAREAHCSHRCHREASRGGPAPHGEA
uniref:Leukemia NUP98 fusion partner 1 n=2 Tax=Gasterosteus aculeatus TaxID=69293 RepID=G3PLD4_GASAC